MMQAAIEHPRVPFALVAAVSLGALAVAYASQVWGGLEPCVLCYYQRYAYVAAAAVGLAGLLIGGPLGGRRILLALAGLAFLTGAAIAAFHVGVEQQWWRGTEACHGPGFDPSLSLAELRAQLLDTSFVPCDEVPWSFLGISIAGYNALASLGLAAASLWGAARLRESGAP